MWRRSNLSIGDDAGPAAHGAVAGCAVDIGDPAAEGVGEPRDFMNNMLSFSGFCADSMRFQCGGMFYTGACPGGNNIQCCGNHPCQTNDGRDGVCRDVDACDAETVPGLCPGNNAVQCCLVD